MIWFYTDRTWSYATLGINMPTRDERRAIQDQQVFSTQCWIPMTTVVTTNLYLICFSFHPCWFTSLDNRAFHPHRPASVIHTITLWCLQATHGNTERKTLRKACSEFGGIKQLQAIHLGNYCHQSSIEVPNARSLLSEPCVSVVNGQGYFRVRLGCIVKVMSHHLQVIMIIMQMCQKKATPSNTGHLRMILFCCFISVYCQAFPSRAHYTTSQYCHCQP